MTISEQLHFSILSAPVAAADRRALSQAWYSALYRTRPKNASSDRHMSASRAKTESTLQPNAKVAGGEGFAPFSRARYAQVRTPLAFPGERRAPQLRLARQIEYLVRSRECKRAAATFVLDGTRARVRVLVVAAGGTVRLIAICSKLVRGSVANALEQARYACAARGIVMTASTRADARC